MLKLHPAGWRRLLLLVIPERCFATLYSTGGCQRSLYGTLEFDAFYCWTVFLNSLNNPNI